MNEATVWAFFDQLWSDVEEKDQFYVKKPLLAHYTSLDVLEKILKSDEVWFSNPLLMNDFEELNFGILNGIQVLKANSKVKSALQTPERYTAFVEALDGYVENFVQEHLIDTYVFCLSEHDRENQDGLLSMWRGYGGNGKGAAIIFDTEKFKKIDSSPLIVARVVYGSTNERRAWMADKTNLFADILGRNSIPTNLIAICAAAAFERIKLAALFMKHSGFKEEREWRIVYLKDRDRENRLLSMRHYSIGPRGVEPKFKLRIAPVEGVTASDLSLEKIIHGILLGPTTSSPLARESVLRMIETSGKLGLKDRLSTSSIPYRSSF